MQPAYRTRVSLLPRVRCRAIARTASQLNRCDIANRCVPDVLR